MARFRPFALACVCVLMLETTYSQPEDEYARGLLRALEDTQLGQKLIKAWPQIWGGEREKHRREKYKTPESYAQRPLDPDERELISEMLTFVKDHKKSTDHRESILILLRQIGHVSMIKAITSIIWDKSKLKEQKAIEEKKGWGYHPQTSIMKEAVRTLGCIADEKSVDELLKVLDHPLEEVKIMAVYVLGLLRGDGYAAYGVNAWFQISDEKGEEAAKAMWREW